MKVQSKLTALVATQELTVYANRPAQVIFDGPQQVIVEVETEDGPVEINLGEYTGIVDFHTVVKWKVRTTGIMYCAPRDEVKPERDDISYTSLDLPRPITEIERMLLVQQRQIAELRKARDNVPTNRIDYASAFEQDPDRQSAQEEGSDDASPASDPPETDAAADDAAGSRETS